jgi:molybdopterin-guanine dinucleotide biosynthesis protein A|tara:strand:- start:856 stop:1467 length:612 start_codon:yes stop_codon:yes gene_type:complete
MSENNIIAVILAGGKSRRFGVDKSTTKLGDKTLIEHTISKIKKKFSEILIISNNQEIKVDKKNIFVLKDCIQGQLGPLVGVLSAMKWIETNNKKYDWVATFPCDTPFFDISIIDEVKRFSKKNNKKLYFIKSGKKRHNIFGLWSIQLKDILEKDINNNFRKVEEWADKIGLETINIDHGKFDSFLNINTKEDLEEAKKNLDKI